MGLKVLYEEESASTSDALFWLNPTLRAAAEGSGMYSGEPLASWEDWNVAITCMKLAETPWACFSLLS